MANQELMYIHIPHESGMNVQNVVACKSVACDDSDI